MKDLLPILEPVAQTGKPLLIIAEDIDGEAAGDKSGVPVSLSSDGKTIAIGAKDNDGTGDACKNDCDGDGVKNNVDVCPCNSDSSKPAFGDLKIANWISNSDPLYHVQEPEWTYLNGA